MKKVLNFVIKHKYRFLLIILYLLLFIQMQSVCYYGDDFEVLYPVHDVRNFSNIWHFVIDKMNYFWYQWSGRIVGHFTVTAGLSFFGIQFFRILNPIMVFLMCFLCIKILSLIEKVDFEKCLFILSFIIFGLNIYITRETLYWAYAGILYIWFFNLTLLVIYIVSKNYLNKTKIPRFQFILLIIIILAQTFVLEQYGFIVIGFLVFMIIAAIKNKENWKPLIILLIVALIGFLVSTFAPGNEFRIVDFEKELSNFSTAQIAINKFYQFFRILFDPHFFGVYIFIIMILITKKYITSFGKTDNFVKKIPLFISYSYPTLTILSFILDDVNILGFNHYVDVMVHYKLAYPIIILRTLYFILLILNLLYMLFKILKKEHKFIILAFLVSLGSAFLTVMCVRYVGIRYYIYFIMFMLLLFLYYFEEFKNNIEINDILLAVAMIPIDGVLACVLIVLFVLRLFTKYELKFKKQINSLVIPIFICVVFSINIGVTIWGYNYNRKIYDSNDSILRTGKYLLQGQLLYINEVPYKTSYFSWHTNSVDYTGHNFYYGFYLNKFYDKYYSMNSKIVVIIDSD